MEAQEATFYNWNLLQIWPWKGAPYINVPTLFNSPIHPIKFTGLQEPVPGPRQTVVLDHASTDLELFREHCLPIVDWWEEATCRLSVLVSLEIKL